MNDDPQSTVNAVGATEEREVATCPVCAADSAAGMIFCHGCGARLIPDPLVGRTIDGRYQVTRLVGEGGMGAVYEVKHLRLQKRFAMKVIHRDLAERPGFAARFEREALATSKQKHVNCVAVTDYGRAETGELYLVMEFLEGQPLTRLLGQPVAVSTALDIVRQILLALEHAHRTGLVHRDVKADNVMLAPGDDAGWRVKVLDFGLAVEPGDRGNSRITQANVVAGSPTYMAPEQAVGADIDERSDLYSVGVILWYLLVGRPPFAGPDIVELINCKVTTPAPSLHEVAPGVFADELEQLLARLLARQPEDRFSSATELLKAIAALQRSRGGGLSTPGAEPWMRRMVRLPSQCAEAWAAWYRCDGQSQPPSWRMRWHGLWGAGSGRVVLATVVAAVAMAAVLTGVVVSSQVRRRSVAVLSPSQPAPTVLREAPRRQDAAGPRPAPAVTARPDAGLPVVLADGDRRVTALRMLIDKGACREAAFEARRLTRQYQHSALAYYLVGAAEMCRGQVGAALAAYHLAIGADRSYQKDARIIEEVGALLSVPTARDAALSFLVRDLGRAAKDAIVGAATSPDRNFRSKAVAAARRLGVLGQIDWVTVLSLDLDQTESCRQRAATVARLSRLRDERALKVLIDARSARKGRRLKHACVKRQISRAIAVLERRLKRHRGKRRSSR